MKSGVASHFMCDVFVRNIVQLGSSAGNAVLSFHRVSSVGRQGAAVKYIVSQLWEWFESLKEQTDLPLFIATVILIALTVVLIIITLLSIRRRHAKREDYSSPAVRIYKVKKFDPARIVGAYDAAGMTEYLPSLQDSEIKKALHGGYDLLICGRPGIGKSHAAIQNLQSVYPRWHLIEPTKKAVQHIEHIRLRRKRYILLLDDLDEHIRGSDVSAGESVLDLVEHIRTQSKQLIVVATIRNTFPEFEAISIDPKVLSRWKVILLQDWTEERGQELAKKTNVDMENWDQTPLSVKQPSAEMMAKYKSASAKERSILQALKLLRSCGLKDATRVLLREIYLSHCFNGVAEEFEAALSTVNKLGFLKKASDKVEAYDPYLDRIEDWSPQNSDYTAVRNVLVEHKRVPELVVFGTLRSSQGRYQEAEEILRYAVAFSPNSESIHYRLGVVIGKRGQWQEAELSYRRAAQLRPNWATPWYRLSNVLAKQGRQPEAKEAFSRARAVDTEREPISQRCAVAEILWEDDRLEEALDEYNAVLDLDPNYAMAYFQKGRILRKLEKWREAKEAHEAAIRLSPEWAEAHFGLAEPLQHFGDLRGAEIACRKAIALKPSLYNAHTTLAHMLLARRQFEVAEGELRTAIELFPDSARLHSYLGEVFNGLRRNPEAEEEYREAIRLEPKYPEGWLGLGMSLRVQGKIDEAIEANRHVIEREPELAEGHYGLGLCYIGQKKWAEAVKAFRDSIRLKPQLESAHFFLGKTLANQGESKEALEEFKLGLKHGYSEGKSNYEMAKVYCQLGYIDDVLACLRNAVEVGFDTQRLRYDPAFSTLRYDGRFQQIVERGNSWDATHNSSRSGLD